MDTQPLISLIIPVYNTEEYVGKCLDSIFSQTYSNIEVIIVNNGSSGNINKIVEDYRNYYPKRIIKLVVHEKNQGTFHGRGSGMTVADGDYFTFMDADDRVGIDYFRTLVMTAESSNSEIVIADLVHEDENGKAFRYIVDPVRSMDIDIHGTDKVFDFFYSFAGLSYSMYGIWNKLYKRELWDRCLPFIEAIKEQFALCEDAEYTTIFFSQARSVKNLHDQYYYHYVHSKSASAGLASSYEKAERSIRFQGTAFRNMKQHLMRAGLIDSYKLQFETFRGFHQRVMLFHIENSKLTKAEKKRLSEYCYKEFEDQNPGKLSENELFFTQHFVSQTSEFENIRLLIANEQIKVVSFDVFDTALLRNIWQPSDLFDLMSPLYHQLTGQNTSFSGLRVLSEKRARDIYCTRGSFRSEVTLDQIYQELGNFTHLSSTILDKLKTREIELEYQLNHRRESIYSLYQLALYLKKTVIFTSDMYLPANVIAGLLQSNGYSIYHKLFVSSEEGVTKASGDLYKKILKNMPNIRPYEVLHIGDQFQSDVVSAKKNKLQAFYFPKAQDVFCNFTNITYSGSVYSEMFGSLDAFQENFSLRQNLSIVVKRMFDNPFVSFHQESKFNGDPYYMGLFSGGPFVSAICQSLCEKVVNFKIKRITFIGDETEVFEQYFMQLAKERNLNVSTDRINLINTTLYIPPIRTSESLLGLANIINIYAHTPNTLLSGLKPYLLTSIQDDCPHIFEKLMIKPDNPFTDILQAQVFLGELVKYYDNSKILPSQNNSDYVFTSGTNMAANAYIWATLPKHLISIFPHPIFEENMFKPFDSIASHKTHAYLTIFYSLFQHSERSNIGEYCIRTVFRTGILDYLADLQQNQQLVGRELSLLSIGVDNMDYLIEHCGSKDCYIMKPTPLPDDPEYSVSDLWLGVIRKCQQQKTAAGLAMIQYDSMDRLHKLVYLMFFDRKTLKQKLEMRCQGHPVLRSIVFGVYSSLRTAKNIFIRS